MPTVTKRVTTLFLREIPEHIEKFDTYIYAIVARKPTKIIGDNKYAHISPCILNWDQKTITMSLPKELNDGIEGFDDLDPNFFEAIEAAFLALMRIM